MTAYFNFKFEMAVAKKSKRRLSNTDTLAVQAQTATRCRRFEPCMNDSSWVSPSTSGTVCQLVAILDGAFTLLIAGAALALAVPLRMGGGNSNLLLEDAA